MTKRSRKIWKRCLCRAFCALALSILFITKIHAHFEDASGCESQPAHVASSHLTLEHAYADTPKLHYVTISTSINVTCTETSLCWEYGPAPLPRRDEKGLRSAQIEKSQFFAFVSAVRHALPLNSGDSIPSKIPVSKLSRILRQHSKFVIAFLPTIILTI